MNESVPIHYWIQDSGRITSFGYWMYTALIMLVRQKCIQLRY